jgi:hypothetical protein
MRGVWSEPLEVEGVSVGSYRVISDTADAAQILLYEFPPRAMKGDAYIRAKEVCLSVLGGKVDPDQAREAFIAAAAEGDVSVRQWQRNVPEGRRAGTRWDKRKRA